MKLDPIIDIIIFAPDDKISEQSIRDVCNKLDVIPTVIERDIRISGRNFIFFDDEEVLDLVIDDVTHTTRLVIKTPCIIHTKSPQQ